MWEWNNHQIFEVLHEAKAITKFALVHKTALSAYRSGQFVLLNFTLNQSEQVVYIQATGSELKALKWLRFTRLVEICDYGRLSNIVADCVQVALVYHLAATYIEAFID